MRRGGDIEVMGELGAWGRHRRDGTHWGKNGVIGMKWGHLVEMDDMGEMAEVREMGMVTLSNVGKVRGMEDMGEGVGEIGEK